MRLLLLHGPAISASRKKLLELKEKFNSENVIVFEEGADTQTILTNLQSPSLFGGERLIIIENSSDDFTNYTLNPNSYTLALWFDHEIDPKKYPKAEVLFFPEAKEASVFPFLDLLASKNTNAFLEIDKLKKAGLDTQYFITMIFYLLRSLVYLPKNAHPFAKQKATKQRKNFSQDEIISLYKFMLDLDFKIKKGLIEPKQAEFLLISRFLDFGQN